MTPQEYSIATIDLDIYDLKKYSKNLKLFALYEIRKNNKFAKNYYSIIEELERIAIRINNLENRKLEILNLN